jgi:serine/threonine protein kinase
MRLSVRRREEQPMSFRIGNFQVIARLGTGAHSTILHVRRPADGRSYALKVVLIHGKKDLKFLEQAEHEFRVARMLDHPNLIKIHTLEKVRNWLFQVRKVHLLIEYVNGKTLDQCPPLGIPKLVQLFRCLADGLTHMHFRRVYHGDLKPNNIMVSRTGEVKIIDYGLATIRGEAKDRLQGTPEYMAPEQARRRIIDAKTDIYNLGATMYRMITMRLPPTYIPGRGDETNLRMDHRTAKRMLKPVQDLTPGAPRELCELIHHCLAYKAANRPAAMENVRQVLEELSAEVVRTPEDRLDRLEW